MNKKNLIWMIIFSLVATSLVVSSAWAHHGAVSAAFGPGTPVETSSPLTLVKGMWLLYEKFQYVPYKKYDRFEPENVDSFIFYNTLLGYGVTDYFSTYVILPYSVKKQDDLGTSKGFGDVELLFQLGFKYGDRQGIKDWYLFDKDDSTGADHTMNDLKCAILAGFTIPNGITANKDDNGETFELGMQPGFGAPAFSLTGVVSKMVFPHFTLAADTVYRTFTQTNEDKPGNEWRANVAGVYDIYEKKGAWLSRVDLIGEANYLHLTKDQGGDREEDPATGGDILYLSPGFRLTFADRLSVGTAIQFPTWKNLNGEHEQQGAEGLEKFRLSTTISYSF